MIQKLKEKANNEKYYKSIRYFSHSMKGEKRRAFISEVAKYNIYLAAQCIMSAEKDESFELILKSEAEELAGDFNNPALSAKGFLALAEFENYEIISKLLLNVIKPSNLHLQVFTKILENNNQIIFLSFIDILTKVQKVAFIHYAVSAYNGDLIIDNSNKKTIKEMFDLLFKNGNFGMARIIIEKYNLYKDISFIFKASPLEIVEKLLNSKKKIVNAVKLAYTLSSYFELFNIYTPELFIEKALKQKLKSNKGLIHAIEIAITHKIRNNEVINERLEVLLSYSHRKTKNKVNQLVKKGLLEYIAENESLRYSYDNYITSLKIKTQKADSKPIVKAEKINSNKIEIKALSVAEKIDNYLKISNRNLDLLIKSLIDNDNATLMEISHLMRKYEFNGIVRHITDYGFYIKPIDFKSKMLLFLHKNQVSVENATLSTDKILTQEQQIQFRIIGINQQNHRLNISCLDKFKPDNMNKDE